MTTVDQANSILLQPRKLSQYETIAGCWQLQPAIRLNHAQNKTRRVACG